VPELLLQIGNGAAVLQEVGRERVAHILLGEIEFKDIDLAREVAGGRVLEYSGTDASRQVAMLGMAASSPAGQRCSSRRNFR
jgi:hypothetical protein